MTKAMVSVEAAGRSLGVSRSTIWRRIKQGLIPSIRQGGRRLVPSAALKQGRGPRDQGKIPPFHENHPIFRLAGAGRSGGKTPGARDKHGILDQ